ncbi:Ras-related protein Rap-2a [Intoshia linei]|uniref:Ras-related protein Rap-2a n=1 Tax=Intoshia linei TaxID=1819745 RepID=A0A177AYH9_9BILA|nr:Ras-related protein Rap-2a [Intoshia linei]
MLYLKTVILGSGGVGKSAITYRYINQSFHEKYDPTIEDHYKKSHDKDTIMEVIDTAGTEQFTAMRDLYMKTGNIFILVYTITSRITFKDIELLMLSLKRIIKEENKNDALIIIIGNKCDLQNEREVSTSEGEAYALKHDCIFYETSAKNNINIHELFQRIVDEKKAILPKKSDKKSRKCPCVVI